MSKYDQISLTRIESAHPSIREKLRKSFMEASDQITGKVFLRLAYVTRSFAEQTALYNLGRTVLFQNGVRQGIVTFAKAGQSFHNYGLAFDMVLVYRDAPKASFDIEVDFDNDSEPDWMEAVKVFEKYGFEWGGNWSDKKKDLPHFQETFGLDWQYLFKLYQDKKFISGTQFVQL